MLVAGLFFAGSQWEAILMTMFQPRSVTPLRWLAAALFVFVGSYHFIHAQSFRRIVPPGFPSPAALVAISGFFEILGGVCLLIPRLRRVAGWGLIALLVAVFPANIYMVINPDRTADSSIPMWILWLRLPMQGVLIAWVWFVSKI